MVKLSQSDLNSVKKAKRKTIARIAKAASPKLPGKSSLNGSFACPVHHDHHVYHDFHNQHDHHDHNHHGDHEEVGSYMRKLEVIHKEVGGYLSN